jgi:biopolymer transport protein ExbB
MRRRRVLRRPGGCADGAAAFFVALCLAALATGRAPAAPSSSMAATLEQARIDVKESSDELNAWRDRVAERRLPLAERVRELERDVAGMRDRLNRLQADAMRGEHETRERMAEIRQREDHVAFVQTLLAEYRRAMEARAGTAEVQAMAANLAKLDDALQEQADTARLPTAVQLVLSIAEEWNRRRLGGYRFDGLALDADGREHRGVFLQWGPLGYFLAEDERAAGWVVTRLGSALPGFEGLWSQPAQSGLSEILAGQSRPLPLDATGGDAVRLRAARRSLVEHVEQGGVVMIPILALGLIAFALIAIKALQMRKFQVGDAAGIGEVLGRLREEDVEGARERAAAMGVPFGSLLREGIQYRRAPREHIEEILHERLLSYMPDLEKHLGTLAALGGIAPLLGLLGTVTGIMRTFQLVTVFGTGDAKVLSGGISEALVTTEFGLIIAIPALLAHALFARRVRTMVGAMEHGMTVFANALTVKKEAACETS